MDGFAVGMVKLLETLVTFRLLAALYGESKETNSNEVHQDEDL